MLHTSQTSRVSDFFKFDVQLMQLPLFVKQWYLVDNFTKFVLDLSGWSECLSMSLSWRMDWIYLSIISRWLHSPGRWAPSLSQQCNMQWRAQSLYLRLLARLSVSYIHVRSNLNFPRLVISCLGGFVSFGELAVLTYAFSSIYSWNAL